MLSFTLHVNIWYGLCFVRSSNWMSCYNAAAAAAVYENVNVWVCVRKIGIPTPKSLVFFYTINTNSAHINSITIQNHDMLVNFKTYNIYTSICIYNDYHTDICMHRHTIPSRKFVQIKYENFRKIYSHSLHTIHTIYADTWTIQILRCLSIHCFHLIYLLWENMRKVEFQVCDMALSKIWNKHTYICDVKAYGHNWKRVVNEWMDRMGGQWWEWLTACATCICV